MENITYSKKKKGWLAGEDIKEKLTEAIIESSVTLEELENSYTSLIALTSSYYQQEKCKEIYDAIIQLESAKKSLIINN